jgi:hypothetical protein
LSTEDAEKIEASKEEAEKVQKGDTEIIEETTVGQWTAMYEKVSCCRLCH